MRNVSLCYMPMKSTITHSCSDVEVVKFEREIMGFFLTEELLKGLARHLGFGSCERYQMPAETVYKGYIVQTKNAVSDAYYDAHLQRYLDVWVGDSARNSAINWGLWENASSWAEAQEERYCRLLASLQPVLESGKPFSVLDVGCATGYTLDR